MSDEQNAIMAQLDSLPLAELVDISQEYFDPEADADRVPTFESRFIIVKVKNDSQAFEIDETLLKEFRGVIVDFHLTKTWFKDSYEKSGGGNRPDCYSNDSVTPHADSGMKQSEKCATCPRNKFYPDPDPKKAGKKKKDCRDTITLYLWNPKSDKPYLLRVSTMNRKRVSEFIKALYEKGIAKELVTCQFTLFEDKETADVPFSGLTIAPKGTVVQMVPFFKDPANKEMALQWFTQAELGALTPKMIVDRIVQFKKDHAELFETEGAVAGEVAEAAPQTNKEEKKVNVPTPKEDVKARTQPQTTQTKTETKPPVKEAEIYDDIGADENEPPF